MLKIISILSYLLMALQNKDPRMEIMDDEHVMDTKTGVKYCLYDDYCCIMHKDKKIVPLSYLTKEEQDVIWAVKKAITNPVTVQEKQENYSELVKMQREMLSSLYENPQPATSTSHVEVNPEGEDYTG